MTCSLLKQFLPSDQRVNQQMLNHPCLKVFVNQLSQKQTLSIRSVYKLCLSKFFPGYITAPPSNSNAHGTYTYQHDDFNNARECSDENATLHIMEFTIVQYTVYNRYHMCYNSSTIISGILWRHNQDYCLVKLISIEKLRSSYSNKLFVCALIAFNIFWLRPCSFKYCSNYILTAKFC